MIVPLVTYVLYLTLLYNISDVISGVVRGGGGGGGRRPPFKNLWGDAACPPLNFESHCHFQYDTTKVDHV